MWLEKFIYPIILHIESIIFCTLFLFCKQTADLSNLFFQRKKKIIPSASSMIEVIAELVEKYELDKHTNAYRRKEIWELIHKDFVEQTGADHLQIFQVQKKWQNFMAEIKRNPNNEQNILASFDNPDHFMESSMVEDR